MAPLDKTSFRKVMVVDDALIDRVVAKKVMTRHAFAEEVITVESAMDALKYLSAHNKETDELPSLIFLDINMPEMSGFDFLDEYQKLPDDVKRKCIIVMLSSSLHPEDEQRALSSPYVHKFLSKPINADKLREIENGEKPGKARQ
jgi:CheY-like chemotaxis protein